MQIVKYKLGRFTRQGLMLPEGSRIIKYSRINNVPYVYVVQPFNKPSRRFELMIVREGELFEAPVFNAQYVGSVLDTEKTNLFWWRSPCLATAPSVVNRLF